MHHQPVYFHMQLYNRRHQKPFRQHLRTHGTSAEAVLWMSLKRRQLGGFKWRRQFGVGPYVLDFYCPAARLAVELDGAVHDGRQSEDTERTQALATLGIAVFRFENRLVSEQLESVRTALLDTCRQLELPQSESDW